MRTKRGMCVLFVLAGIGLSVAAAVWFWHSTAMVRHYERALGTVVTITAQSRPNHPGQPLYFPVIAFVAQDGASYVFESDINSSAGSYRNKDTVPVRYDPDDPHRAVLASFFRMWGVPLILLGMGLVFVAMGSYAYIDSDVKS